MENLIKTNKIAVVGMGYVGLPLAIAFSEKGYNVIGFDVNEKKIEKYLLGLDPTNEVGDDRIKNSKNIEFTSDEKKLEEWNKIANEIVDKKYVETMKIIWL